MNEPNDATMVHHADVVIIGGGIAGIAITELLSRLTDLNIVLLENSLGSEPGPQGN